MNKNWRLYLLFVALPLIMAGCGPDPFFIPVESIEDVPSTGTTGEPLILTGRVYPGFASKTTIVWLLRDDGTTGTGTPGPFIIGNILYTNTNGTVSIEARIANGAAEGKDYIEDFRIVFSESSTPPSPFISVNALKEWLDNRPANLPSNPYFVKLNVNNASDITNMSSVLNGKYVNIDLSGSAITSIGQSAFNNCTSLVGVTIGSDVTSIQNNAFNSCSNLTSVTINCTINTAADLAGLPDGLSAAYQLPNGGGPGTYTLQDNGSTWIKN